MYLDETQNRTKLRSVSRRFFSEAEAQQVRERTLAEVVAYLRARAAHGSAIHAAILGRTADDIDREGLEGADDEGEGFAIDMDE